MKNFKVGDWVCCKKSFEINNYNINFTKGKYYLIHRESGYNFFILSNSGVECDFDDDDDKYSSKDFTFRSHFYSTKKELRKLKLDKLKENV